jgi:hypothetical protein
VTPRDEVLALLRHMAELQDALRAYGRGEFDITPDQADALRAELREYETRPLTCAQADVIRSAASAHLAMREYLEAVPCGMIQ